MAISLFYLSLFLLSMVAEVFLLKRMVGRRTSYYVVLFTLISVVCLAYFSYSISLDTGMALVANQFSYLDGTFVMMFFIFCILDICNIKVTKWVAVPMTVTGLFFLMLAFTSGYQTLFYENVVRSTYKGSAHLQMEFGPFYSLYVSYVVLTMLIPLGIVGYSAFHKRKISYKYTLALGGLLFAIVLMYFVEIGFGLGFDILPIGYVLMEYVILAVTHRIGLYDISRMALSVSENSKEYGCIIFDKKHHYVGADETAKYYFPELTALDIDREVSDPWIAKEFVDWIDSYEAGNVSSKQYERKERFLRCAMKSYFLENEKVSYGYVIEIWDDTEEQNFIQTLNQMNEDLEKAAEAANAANTAKSMFLANMSHEIRTPINAILGMNEIALRECQDDQMSGYLMDIRNAGMNLLTIINDILDFSKIEAGKIDIVEERYELAKLMKDVVDLIDVKAKEKGLVLKVTVQENLPAVLCGDVNRIRQVMVNLLNNAVKYTKEGTVELEVHAIKEDSETRENMVDFIFKIKDTGTGIKKEDLERLFESFTRVDEKRNSHIEGTGLGLAITKKLIERMSGDIVVESEYGRGSVFTVRLPQRVMDDTPVGDFRTGAVEMKEEMEHIDASGVRILVVDDTMINLRVIQGLLRPTNAEVALCRSGKECLQILRRKSFDLVFMDHMMPEMDGIETMHAAKEAEDIDTTKMTFIALTANALVGVRETYLAAGFDDFLSKPIIPAELEAMIERFCLNGKEPK